MALQEEHVEQALAEASIKVPAFGKLLACEQLDALYATLMGLKPHASWLQQVFIRAVHGLISRLKRKLRCNE